MPPDAVPFPDPLCEPVVHLPALDTQLKTVIGSYPAGEDAYAASIRLNS